MGLPAALSWPMAVAGGVTGGASMYLVTLAGAAFCRRSAPERGAARSRIAVIVPAHNETEMIGRCIASLHAQNYPADLFRIVVVADNCSDDTADMARSAGADVFQRNEPGARGKGRALRWAMDRLLAEPAQVDAIVVVDADSIADPDLLAALEAHLVAGADAVQAEYLVLDQPGTGSELRQAAFLLFHRTRFGGRDALGMPCNLVGNGMLFSRRLLERLPWNAFTGAEDLEYSINLRLAGVRPRFAADARLSGPAPGRGRAAATQRMRWEGGRFHVVRTQLLRLIGTAVRRREWSLLDAAADLAVPPLGLLVLLAISGSAVTAAAAVTGAAAPWAVIPWAVASLGLVAYVLVGLRAARAPAATYLALLSTPRFLLSKIGTYLRMTRGLNADQWQRTERPAEERRRTGDRVDVCGVPVDVVDEATATQRILSAVESGRFLQVSTVNLQFLVTARRRPEVRGALRAAELNVADGAPVLWLARVLGSRLPERVAGADLVPAIMAHAAEGGIRVFFLGGTGGVAAQAAEVLKRRHPGLVIAGCHEPPLSSLSEMDNEGILARIADARAAIVLVGLGHPKQELWIAANRDRLTASVAIGVGGTFDMIAGRMHRAPRWAGRSGLEWLFRLAQEPRRLATRYLVCASWLFGVLLPLAAWSRVLAGGSALPALSVAMDHGDRSLATPDEVAIAS